MGWWSRLRGQWHSRTVGPAGASRRPLPTQGHPASSWGGSVSTWGPPAPGKGRSCAGFAVLDVETTGLSPSEHRILELAVVHTDGHGTVLDEWAVRCDPEGP